MKQPPSLPWLVPLIALLALSAAAAGLFWPGGSEPYPFTTLHGQVAQIDGHGLYRSDNTFFAATFRGTDVVTLLAGLPLLILSFQKYRRGSLAGGLFLAGALCYFLYLGASMTFSAAFNQFFLVYTALFSTSLFALIRLLTAFDLDLLGQRVLDRLPRRGMAVFLMVAGLATLGLWLSELLGPILSGGYPANLGPYTTMFTHGFDSAVLTPACVLAGVYLLRRHPLGYLMAVALQVLCVMVGLTIIAATIAQALAGIIFPPPVYIGMVGSWLVMGLVSIYFLRRFLRDFSDLPAQAAAFQNAG